MNEMREFKRRLLAEIESKNSWGKIELLNLVNSIYTEMLEQIVEAGAREGKQ